MFLADHAVVNALEGAANRKDGRHPFKTQGSKEFMSLPDNEASTVGVSGGWAGLQW
jgi:hypothetical protein